MEMHLLKEAFWNSYRVTGSSMLDELDHPSESGGDSTGASSSLTESPAEVEAEKEIEVFSLKNVSL
jgi:hypothetical protein